MSLIRMGVFFGLVFLGLAGVRADTLVWEAPVVYYPSIEGQDMYESEAVATNETIAGVTANWDYTGKVRLQVSANDGKDYAAVVNGVAQDKGLAAGDRLRWRAYLEPGSALRRVSIAYTDAKKTRQTFGNPQLSGFKFRKAIEIKGSPEAELFNYQLQLNLGESVTSLVCDLHCAGKVGADFRDVRFTASDGESLLGFYRESVSGAPGSRLATFWVKIPQLPKIDKQADYSLRIYLYYGNSAAEDLSSPGEVFDFFEDFSKKSLDPQMWEVYSELKGKAGVADGQLILKNSKILSRGFKLQDGIIEYKAQAVGSCGIQGIVRDKKEVSAYAPVNQMVYSSAFPGAEHTIAVADIVKANVGSPVFANRSYIYRITAEKLNIIFERFGAETAESQAQLRFSDIAGGLTEGYLGLKGECARGTEGVVYFDWFRVRQYTPSLPVIMSVGKEEEANLAYFHGLTLSKEGNLILADDKAASAKYTSALAPVDFNVRLMSLDAKYPVNISADAGKTYKQNAQTGTRYYASKGDFSVGQRISWQAGLSDGASLSRVSLSYYPGVITLLSPNAGEEVVAGSVKEILWSAQEYDAQYLFKLEYSLDKGKSYATITHAVANSGSYEWRVLPGLKSTEALIRISDALAPAVSDVSDQVFSIR